MKTAPRPVLGLLSLVLAWPSRPVSPRRCGGRIVEGTDCCALCSHRLGSRHAAGLRARACEGECWPVRGEERPSMLAS